MEMTVFDLIKELTKFDPQMNVHVKISNTGRTAPVEAVYEDTKYDEDDGEQIGDEKVTIE